VKKIDEKPAALKKPKNAGITKPKTMKKADGSPKKTYQSRRQTRF